LIGILAADALRRSIRFIRIRFDPDIIILYSPGIGDIFGILWIGGRVNRMLNAVPHIHRIHNLGIRRDSLGIMVPFRKGIAVR